MAGRSDVWALRNPALQRAALGAAAERQYRWADLNMRRRMHCLLAEVAIMIAASACASPQATTKTAAPIVRTASTLPAAADLPRPKRLWHRRDLQLRPHTTYAANAVIGETWFSTQDDTIMATDVATGRPLWTRKIGAGWLSVFGGRLIVEADGPKLMALDPSNGATIWTSSTGCGIEHGNFFVEGDVVIGSFHCDSAKDGARVPCEHAHETLVLSLRNGQLIRRAPEAGPPRRYVGVSRGRAIAVRYHGFSKAGTSAPHEGEPSFSLESTDVLTGKETWKVEMQGIFPTDGVIGDVVILAGPRAVGVDAASGRTLWTSDVNDQPPPSNAFHTLDGRFIRVTKTAVEAIDPATGRAALVFEMPSLDRSAVGPRGLFVDDIVVGRGRVTASLEGYLVTWDASGRHAFQSPAVPYGLGAVAGDVILVAVRSEPGMDPGVTAVSLRDAEQPRTNP